MFDIRLHDESYVRTHDCYTDWKGCQRHALLHRRAFVSRETIHKAFWQTAIYKETSLGFDSAVNDMRLFDRLQRSLFRTPGKKNTLKWHILPNHITNNYGLPRTCTVINKRKRVSPALPKACDTMLWHCFSEITGVYFLLFFSNASQRFWGGKSTEARSPSCCDSHQAPAPAVRKYNPLRYSEISYWSAFLQSSIILFLNNR